MQDQIESADQHCMLQYFSTFLASVAVMSLHCKTVLIQ